MVMILVQLRGKTGSHKQHDIQFPPSFQRDVRILSAFSLVGAWERNPRESEHGSYHVRQRKKVEGLAYPP